MKYKIIVAYDGTDYAGWQYQDDQPSVAGTLQKTFKRVFNREITIIGVSRTDAGVHALGQVATFKTDLPLDAESIKFAWSNILPQDIYIKDIQMVRDEYSPHQFVSNKIYYYHFFQKRPLPFLARYGWFYHKPISLDKLQECLNVFVGTHDFRSFCSGHDRPDTIRTIHEVSITYFKKYGIYRITVKGPKFLRYMIRRIVGACLQVASHDTLVSNDLKIALEQKNPHQLFLTAPAQGLVLHKIIYDQEHTSND